MCLVPYAHMSHSGLCPHSPCAMLQFLFRDVNVVGVRMAAVTDDELLDVCADARLQLDPSPLVYYYPGAEYLRGVQYHPCPLQGTNPSHACTYPLSTTSGCRVSAVPPVPTARYKPLTCLHIPTVYYYPGTEYLRGVQYHPCPLQGTNPSHACTYPL